MSIKIKPVNNTSEVIHIAKKLFLKVDKSLEELINENKGIKNDIVVSGIHRGLSDLYESSCILLIQQSADKEKAKRIIFESMEHIKNKIERYFN